MTRLCVYFIWKWRMIAAIADNNAPEYHKYWRYTRHFWKAYRTHKQHCRGVLTHAELEGK